MKTPLYDQKGNLHETITLSYGELVKKFGNNEKRKELINKVLLFLKILGSFNCKTVYITGSFVSNEESPGDIDLCVNTTGMDLAAFTREYEIFLTNHGIEKIKKEHNVHFVLFFNQQSIAYLDKFKKDRNDDPRGFVKLLLNDIEIYDQQRETI